MDCKEVGWAVQQLGAGRAKPGDPVSAHAGIESHAKLGDRIESGQPLFTLLSEDPDLPGATRRDASRDDRDLGQALRKVPLVREVISS